MPRPTKYSTPELKATAKAYTTIKKQREREKEAIGILGGQCRLCGTTDIKVLQISGPPIRNAKAFPQLFSLRCANCNAAALYEATSKRLEEYHAVLIKEEFRRAQDKAAEAEAKDKEQEAKEQAAREHTLAQQEALSELKQRRAAEIEEQFQREQEEQDRLAEEEKNKHV